MAGIGHYWAIYITCNFKYFANMTSTIYGNRLPRGTQLKKLWESLV
jgi:hypothetical protein